MRQDTVITAGCRRIILLGPPGSGKGTLGRALADWIDVPHVSSGQLLRASVRAGDPHGVAERIANGNFVPDSVVAQVVHEHLGDGFILDGYPRTAEQAEELDGRLALDGRDVQVVLHLDVPEEEIYQRLTRRAELEGRADDTPETVAHRLEVYRREVGPLLDHYRVLVTRLDGVGTPEDVADRARRLLEAEASSPAAGQLLPDAGTPGLRDDRVHEPARVLRAGGTERHGSR